MKHIAIYTHIVFTLAASTLAATYDGGTGTPEDPYQIRTAEQMNEIGLHGEDRDKHFVLMADIDMTAYKGDQFNAITRFSGRFDGDGHVISGFEHGTSETYSAGLFADIVCGAEITQLGLEEPVVSGNYYVGALVGYSLGGTVSKCYVEGGQVASEGLAYVGGLVGYNDVGVIENCYATTSVSGDGITGGLAGVNSGIVMFSYSAGSVLTNAASWLAGGLLGMNYGRVMSCYWDIETSGLETGDGGEGRSTGEMRKAETFAGWGGMACWKIDEGEDYPRLNWQASAGISLPYECPFEGSGTSEDPYQILDANDLTEIGLHPNEWDKHFVLMNDVDLAGYGGTRDEPQYNVIGYYGYVSTYPYSEEEEGSVAIPFCGVFDGNGHTISNLYLRYQKGPCALFGCVGCGGRIANLELTAVRVDPLSLITGEAGYVAGLAAAMLEDSLIENCHIEDGFVQGHGGLVGRNYRGVISNCSFQGVVTLWEGPCGGLVGFNKEGTIADCEVAGEVWVFEGDVGGLVGENREGDISDCSVTGEVSGSGNVGGLVGENYNGMVSDCATDVYVSADGNGGGVAGINCGSEAVIIRSSSFSLVGESTLNSLSMGGLVGYNCGGSSVSHCYSEGLVTGTQAGGLVGFSGGLINDCRSWSEVKGGSYVGGLVGVTRGHGATIGNCSSVGPVTGDNNSGGLIGDCDWGTMVEGCYSTSAVSGDWKVGGLIGQVDAQWSNSECVRNCYAMGSVDGNNAVGGLIGYLYNGQIEYCYSTGRVRASGSGYIYEGGLIGQNFNCEVTSSFWDWATSEQTGSAGGTGRSIPTLYQSNTFIEVGWDFVAADDGWRRTDVWRMCVDGVDYPRLSWELGRYGDFTCPDGVGMEDVAYLAERWVGIGDLGRGAADANGDERVDMRDFAVLTDNWSAD